MVIRGRKDHKKKLKEEIKNCLESCKLEITTMNIWCYYNFRTFFCNMCIKKINWGHTKLVFSQPSFILFINRSQIVFCINKRHLHHFELQRNLIYGHQINFKICSMFLNMYVASILSLL